MEKEKLVEIARSFSYKHNLGNFQSCDFFCSQKAEVPEAEAEETSHKLYLFCKGQVAKALSEFLKTGLETPQAPVEIVEKKPWKCADGHTVSGGKDRCEHPDHYPADEQPK